MKVDNHLHLTKTNFGDSYGVNLDACDAIIVMYNEGYGWKPYQMLLPGQLYEDEVKKKLEELGRQHASVGVVPIRTSQIQTVATYE